MEKFVVSSLPIKDVISDMAQELGTNYSENCSIYQLFVPSNYGEGRITGIDFDDGLGLIRYDCKFNTDVVFEFSVDKIHPVKFLFCNEGSIEHLFTNETIQHDIPQYKNAIVASSKHHGHVLKFESGRRTVMSSLELDRRKFQQKISCELRMLGNHLRNLLNDVSATRTFYHEGYYSLELSELFKKWRDYKNNGLIRKFYLEGLAYHILVLQIKQFRDDTKSEGSKMLLRKSEHRQLKKVLETIDEKIADLPTIDNLASEVGLSTKKLQLAFQHIFGKTVNEYIVDKRMEVARALLRNSDMPLKEISSLVGYRNQSYFARVFRKKFGALPSEFISNMKNSVSLH